MMETNQMTKQILDFQRGAFSSWYSVMTAMQEQAVSSLNTVLDQSNWMPDEGRRMVLTWVSACKKGRDDVKGLVEESFSGLEKVMVKPSNKTKTAKRPTPKAKPEAPAKPKPPAAVVRKAAAPQAQKPVFEEKTTASAGDKDKIAKPHIKP